MHIMEENVEHVTKVRKFTTQQKISEEQGANIGFGQKAKEFRYKAVEASAKP